MGWRTQEAYESEAHERWRSLAWRERYGWQFVCAMLVLAIIAALLLLMAWPGAMDAVRAWTPRL